MEVAPLVHASLQLAAAYLHGLGSKCPSCQAVPGDIELCVQLPAAECGVVLRGRCEHHSDCCGSGDLGQQRRLVLQRPLDWRSLPCLRAVLC